MKREYSIYELAERLGNKVWEKDNLKRIYVNIGYNTRKMSTVTFIWQDENGEFRVSCHIECPSQPWNWIKSQKEDVVRKVEDKIHRALADTYYIPVRKVDGMVFDYGCISSREKFMLYPDRYISKEDAIKDMENCYEYGDPEEYEIIEISREDAENESERAWQNYRNNNTEVITE
jgi:hypothetical protein